MTHLTQPEFDALWRQALESNEVWSTQGNERWCRLPRSIGSGQRHIMTLRDGFQLWLDHFIYDRSLHLDYRYRIPQIALTFYLSGDFRIINPGLAKEEDRTEVAGESCICYLPDIRSIEYHAAQKPLQRITILVDLDFLKAYPDLQSLPRCLQSLIEGRSITPFHQTFGQANRSVQGILQQILTCPYQGTMRHFYLESKALELLALQFTRWRQDETLHAQKIRWKPQDLEKLHSAREILQRSFNQSPPSLLELAQQVKLSDYKLKQGFRQVFGTTVFGYLRTYQLEHAQRLLRETNLSITEIAYEVGYGSLPAFSNAFYKQLGISPRDFRQQ